MADIEMDVLQSKDLCILSRRPGPVLNLASPENRSRKSNTKFKPLRDKGAKSTARACRILVLNRICFL